MRILITGGAGFIGSHLAEHFKDSADIVILDNLRTGYRLNLEGITHTFIEGSVTDRKTVDRAMRGVDLVFHLAAMISVPESMAKPGECVDINVLGLLNVLGSAAAAGAKKLVLASSAAIYGDNPTVPKTEDMLPEPKSPYAITKLDGEYYLEMFRRESNLDTCSLRFFNVFGPRQDPKGAYAAAVPIFIEKALSGEPITIFGNGGQTRDFIYVKDIVSAMAFAASNGEANGVHNVGCGETTSILDLAESIIALTGSTSRIGFAPARAGDVRHSLASAASLRDLGWEASYGLSLGLEEMLSTCPSLPSPPRPHTENIP